MIRGWAAVLVLVVLALSIAAALAGKPGVAIVGAALLFAIATFARITTEEARRGRR